jgi:hypothetical protein
MLAGVGPASGSPLDQVTTGPPRVARPHPTTTAKSPAQRTTATPRGSRSNRPPYVPAATPTLIKHAPPPPHGQKPLPAGRLPVTSQSLGVDSTVVPQTYHILGGSATLRFSPAEAMVQVISVTPAPGYRVYLDRKGADELILTFTRPGREADLHATWNGEATAEVTEYLW